MLGKPEEMKLLCTIAINSACPGKVVGIQNQDLRHRMKDSEKKWKENLKERYKGSDVKGTFRVEVDFARKQWKGNSPDIDNMLKVVFDSLKGCIVDDDRHIISVEAKKLTGKDSTVVRVYCL